MLASVSMCWHWTRSNVYMSIRINPLNAELNPICHLLALLGAHLIFHVSGLRVKVWMLNWKCTNCKGVKNNNNFGQITGIQEKLDTTCKYIYIYIYIYICFKTSFYVVRHLDSTASSVPTGLHLGFFRSWPSLYLPSRFSSVFFVIYIYIYIQGVRGGMDKT